MVAHEAIRQHLHAGKRRNAPKPFDEARLPLVIQEERAIGNASDQMAALVGLEVAQRPHGVHYTIISHNPTTRPPPLGADPRKPRFTGLTENCYTTNQSQESTCLTMLHNEYCVGYWKAQVDFEKG